MGRWWNLFCVSTSLCGVVHRRPHVRSYTAPLTVYWLPLQKNAYVIPNNVNTKNLDVVTTTDPGHVAKQLLAIFLRTFGSLCHSLSIVRGGHCLMHIFATIKQ